MASRLNEQVDTVRYFGNLRAVKFFAAFFLDILDTFEFVT
jgi:hypothetical protein